MKCKHVQESLSNYFDDTLASGQRTTVEVHLKSCEACRMELQALETIVSEAKCLEQVRAPQHLWSSIVAQMDGAPQPVMVSVRKTTVSALFRLPAPVFKLAGLAAVLVIGILIGRHIIPDNGADAVAPIAANTDDFKVVNARADTYIEKSKILFLGIVNADASEAQNSGWQSEQKVARTLLTEAAYLKENLSRKRNERVNQLVDELEMILLEIANLEEEQDLKNIEMIKSGIDRKSLMLKIYLHDLSKPDTPIAKPL